MFFCLCTISGYTELLYYLPSHSEPLKSNEMFFPFHVKIKFVVSRGEMYTLYV